VTPLANLQLSAYDRISGTHKQVLRIYVQHYNQHRPLSLEAPDPPTELSVAAKDRQGKVHRRDLLGGLLHEYRRAA
jgi:putative transposase